MGVAESLEGHFNSFLVNGGVATNATLASTSPDAGNDTDSRNENIRNINNLTLDVALAHTAISNIVRVLRANGLIQGE